MGPVVRDGAQGVDVRFRVVVRCCRGGKKRDYLSMELSSKQAAEVERLKEVPRIIFGKLADRAS